MLSLRLEIVTSSRYAYTSKRRRAGWNHSLLWADTTREWAVDCVLKASQSLGVHAGWGQVRSLGPAL
jgi:hypothetical protein